MLDQRLWRWRNIKPALGECAVFAGEALPANTCNMAWESPVSSSPP